MQPVKGGAGLRRVRASALAFCILVVGCRGLRPLPAPRLASCMAVGSLAQLWSCLDEIDTRLDSGIGRAEPRESAFESTTRVVNGDLRRKLGDQEPSHACGGIVPAGFTLVPAKEAMAEAPGTPETPAPLEAAAPGAGRAPLFAYYRPPSEPRLPTVIVIHGLYDSKHSRYVRLVAENLAARGFGVLAPDMRWHGCLLRWLPTLGLEEAKDLVAWRDWLRRRAPESPVGLLGISLGCLDVIQALALDAGGEIFAAGGVALSPPASLRLTLSGLDDPPYVADYGGLSLVRRFFQDALRTRMRNLKSSGAGGLDPEAARPFGNFLSWLAGRPPFPPGTTEDDLLRLAEPGPRLALVRRPLVLIASRRDPIFSELAVSDLQAAVAANPALHLFSTTDGGHIGQLGTYPQWMADLVARFFHTSPGVA